MSVNVPLERLRSELDGRSNAAYLLTVGDDGGPHCVAVTVSWQDDELVIRSGTTSVRNAATRRRVALLSPPAPFGPASGGTANAGGAADTGGEPLHGDYSLIVDGEVTATSLSDDGAGGAGGRGDGEVRVKPTHAVLHRPAVAPDGARLHDCASVYDEAGTQS